MNKEDLCKKLQIKGITFVNSNKNGMLFLIKKKKNIHEYYCDSKQLYSKSDDICLDSPVKKYIKDIKKLCNQEKGE